MGEGQGQSLVSIEDSGLYPQCTEHRVHVLSMEGEYSDLSMNICLPRSALGRLDRKVEARVRSSGKILLQQKYLCSDQSPKCFLFPIDAFKLWCWRRLLRVPWRARRSHQSILKEINPEYLLEGLMLRLKLQYLGYLLQRANSLEKTLMLGKIEGGRRSG